MASEFERIARLHRIFGPPPQGVSLGIGDDAAVLSIPQLARDASQLVWTVDSSVEGIHFRRDLVDWQDIGWRSFMAAASDLAAMGAEPVGALSALMLTADISDEQLDALARGQNQAARSIGTAIIGGNLSRAGELSITTTVIGRCLKASHRDGAHAGDLLVVCGELGLAAAGLRILLETNGAWSSTDPDQCAAVSAWRRPVARIDEGVRIAQVSSAQIDVSDGLAQDAGHIAEASGVRIELDAATLVSPRLRSVGNQLGFDPLELALSGGEDYAVLATVPPALLPANAHVVGRCASGQGVWVEHQRVNRRVDQLGYNHFR